MDNKKILWIVTELFPPDETSTSYILGEIANAMTLKYKVKIICGPEIYDKRKKIDADNKFKLDGSIEVFRAKGSDLDKNTMLGKALSFLFMSKRLYSLAKTNVRKNDKVLMVTNPAPLMLLMSRLKSKIGFEWHVLVHDVFPENTVPAQLKIPMYGTVKRLFDKAYNNATQLIAIGRDMQTVLLQKISRFQRGNASPKITIIENWADTDGIEPQMMPEGEGVILEYAGNIGRVQGLDKIIKKLPKNVELHIYGTGAMENELKRLKHPQVFFHGPYFRSQQTEVLAACHISIVTLQEGMYGLGVPSKTYNILASGRSVLFIGPKDSEIDLLVREQKVGYCAWPEKWDLEELKAMGERARELAENKYAKRIILNKFLAAI